MKCEIDYRKPQSSQDEPRCYIRLYPETPQENGRMDTIMDIFSNDCELIKALNWENTHYVISLKYKNPSSSSTVKEAEK